jgi:hypothetical protein
MRSIEIMKDKSVWLSFYPIITILLINWFFISPLLVVSFDIENIKRLFLISTRNVIYPEQLEIIRYITSILIPPVVYLIFMYFWRYLIADSFINKHESFLSLLVGLANLLVLIIIITALWFQNNYVHAYFNYITIFSIMFIVIGLNIYKNYYRDGYYFNIILKRITNNNVLQYLIVLLFILLVLSPSIYFSDNINLSQGWVKGHLEYTFAEYASVYNGHTLYVNYYPQYQNIIQYLAIPIFNVFGLSISTFVLLMVSMSFIGLTCIYLGMARFGGTNYTTLVFFVIFLLFSSFPIDEMDNGERYYIFNYYAASPFRTFGPWLLFYLSAIYLHNPNYIRMVVLNLIGVFFLINNFESGVPVWCAVVSISWIGISESPWKIEKAKITITLTIIMLSAIAVIASSIILTYIRTGHFPEVMKMFAYQQLFAKVGFMAMPMPVYGIHWVFYITAMVTILTSLNYMFLHDNGTRSINRIKSGLFMFSSFYLVGSLMYYVGRSHWHNIISVFPAFSLSMTLLMSDRIYVFNENNRKLFKITDLLLFVYFCIGISTLFSLPSPVKQYERINKEENSFAKDINAAAQFLATRLDSNQRVGIIFGHAGLISRRANVVNVFPFANINSLITLEQLDDAIIHLNNNFVRHIFGSYNNITEFGSWLDSNGFKEIGAIQLSTGVLFKHYYKE